MPDVAPVFSTLRAVLAPYAARLVTVRDDDRELSVDTRHVQANGKPLFFGAVQRKTSTVAFHLMPVYAKPELLASLSPALRARLKGKSCFHFTTVDPALVAELAALVEAGHMSYAEQGFID